MILGNELLSKYDKINKRITPDINITSQSLKKQSKEINDAFAKITTEDICAVFSELDDCYDELFDFLDLGEQKTKILAKYLGIYHFCLVLAINRANGRDKYNEGDNNA